MKVAIFIPARYGSTRLPGKPLMKLKGREVLGHVIDSCLKAFGTDYPLYVATDDGRIAAFVNQQEHCQAVMTSAHCSNGTLRIHDALNSLAKTKKVFDAILHIQSDEPFISKTILEKLSKLTQEPHVQMATIVAPLHDRKDVENPHIVKVALGENDRAVYFSRAPIPYGAKIFYGHVGVYGWKREALDKYAKYPKSRLETLESLEQLRWLENGGSIHCARVEKLPQSINIPQDLESVKKELAEGLRS